MAINLQLSTCNYSSNGNNALVESGYYYVFTNAPAWFQPVEFLGVISGAFFFYPPGPTGAFVIDVAKHLSADDSLVDSGIVTITVTSCVEEYAPRCCDNVYNIGWLSPEGGWKNYFFIGKATTGVDQDKGSDYKDADNTLKWSQVENVYDTVIVGTSLIPKDHVDYTKSLRYAIQAYIYDTSTGTWSIPIVINRDSFQLYRRGDKLFEFSLEFKYAVELVVQTQ